MHPSKTTDNKLRWEADVDGVPFKLYVPKWRVPVPWPVRVLVAVSGDAKNSTRRVRPGDHVAKRERGIEAVVRRVSSHTETARFAPIGAPEDWEIGEPYIPYSLLPTPDASTVRIDVQWDRSSGTWSD